MTILPIMSVLFTHRSKYNGIWYDCHTREMFSDIKTRFNPPFSTFENACTSQEYDSSCPIVWCVLSFDFAIWLRTFCFEFSSKFSVLVVILLLIEETGKDFSWSWHNDNSTIVYSLKWFNMEKIFIIKRQYLYLNHWGIEILTIYKITLILQIIKTNVLKKAFICSGFQIWSSLPNEIKMSNPHLYLKANFKKLITKKTH